jgi:hypothetical protein
MSSSIDRASVTGRILSENDVLEFKWNALENIGPPPEYVPVFWTSRTRGGAWSTDCACPAGWHASGTAKA